ncbi:MAG: flagellar hook-basal body complex protein FliE [Dethiobacteria bacterium]
MPQSVGGTMFPRNIEGFSRLLPKEAKVEESNDKSFSSHLFEALSRVNNLQKEADQASVDLLTGDLDDLHLLMIKTEEARLALQFTVQTTTKIIEAYQELARIQI